MRRLTPRRVRVINVAVTALATVTVILLFILYVVDSGISWREALREMPIFLAGVVVILVTSVFIASQNASRARMEGELKTLEARRRYEDLVELATDAIIVHDGEGVIEAANPAAAALFGVTRGQLVGSSLFARLLGGSCAPERDRSGAVPSTLTITRPDGGTVLAEAVSTTFSEGGVEKGMQIIRDVTDRERFQAHRRQLERLAGLGQMAAKISHEINNPLTYILSTAETGAEKAEDAASKRSFVQIQGQVERIMNITNSYLGLARRPEEGRRAVDLEAMIREALSFFVASGHGKHLDISVEIGDDLPPICGDWEQLTRVLMNLFINAAHATEDTETRALQVSAGLVDGEVAVAVTDSGVGIPPELVGRIFDPYFTTKPKGKGTGLGLAVVREIVQDEHGGSITIDSTPGKGTTFTLRFPALAEGQSCGGSATGA